SDQFGHVLLKRQLNNLSVNKFVFKIFNLNQYTITSEFGEDATKEEMLMDLEKIQLINDIQIAPELLKVNLNEKYYIENYLNLRHLQSNQWEKCIPLINHLIKILYDSFVIKSVEKSNFISNKKLEISNEFLNKPKFVYEIR